MACQICTGKTQRLHSIGRRFLDVKQAIPFESAVLVLRGICLILHSRQRQFAWLLWAINTHSKTFQRHLKWTSSIWELLEIIVIIISVWKVEIFMQESSFSWNHHDHLTNGPLELQTVNAKRQRAQKQQQGLLPCQGENWNWFRNFCPWEYQQLQGAASQSHLWQLWEASRGQENALASTSRSAGITFNQLKELQVYNL